MGEVTLLRGLNASGLASLFLTSLSSLVSTLGSLLMRNDSIACWRVGLLAGTNRSGVLKEPADFVVELLSPVLIAGRRRGV